MKNIFSSRIYTYILILFIVSLSPLLLEIKLPKQLIPVALPTTSSFNLDTGNNNDFKITILTGGKFISKHVYVDAFQFRDYSILNQKITIPQFVKKGLIDTYGNIYITNVGAGKYLLLLRSIPLQLQLLGKYWIVDVASHNPNPLTLE